MSGIFACPECGLELSVDDSVPGRQVQCEGCSTWVEVPYLPRGGGWKRPRRRPWWWESKALRGAVVFAGVACLILVAARGFVGRARSGKEAVLAELLASAGSAESAGRFDVALREIEAALAQARSIEPNGSARLDQLKDRRDRISLREAEGRLEAVDSLDPDRAVGESLTILARSEADPALEPLAGSIHARVDASRLRQAEADLDRAGRSLDSGDDASAFLAAERLHDRAGHLPNSDSKRFRAEARAVIDAAVGRSGAAIPPVSGRFVAGSAEGFTRALARYRAEALKARGYLPQPRPDSPWASVWDEKAPFRLALQVSESQDGLYLQSRNRISQIDGTFELSRDGHPAWSTRTVARTRTPLPDLPAYLAGHLATSDKRNPEAERRLHDDALTQFVEQAVKNLRGIPAFEAPARPH